MSETSGQLALGAAQGLLGWLALGGPVMLVIGALSVVALAIVLIKVWHLHRARIERVAFVETVLERWRAGDGAAAIERLGRERGPLAQVLVVAVRGLAEAGAPVELVREEALRVAVDQLERARAYLRGLEVIAAVSPLLGLLGTVLGMIDVFRTLELAGAGAGALAGGIWEALLTTAAGLGVAIPTLVALSWLERRVDRLRHRMEDSLTRVFTARALGGVVP